MCHIWNTDYDPAQETTMEQKKRLVSSLKGVVEPGFEFHLSGGEPLISEGILELVDFIADQGYKTNLVTNAFLIDERMARDIAASSLGTLTISLDGIKAETHDFIRGVNGSYERIMKAIGYVDKFRKGDAPRISILTTIMERNIDELLRLADWVQSDRRLEMISFQAITQPFCEEADQAWFTREKNRALWPQDAEKTAAVMDKLEQLKRQGRKIGNHPDHFRHFGEYFRSPDTFLKKIKCNLGDYEFHIDPYGKVFFCCLVEPIGNIKSDDTANIWFTPNTARIRQEVYNCRRNCHIMINCFYEEEKSAA